MMIVTDITDKLKCNNMNFSKKKDKRRRRRDRICSEKGHKNTQCV